MNHPGVTSEVDEPTEGSDQERGAGRRRILVVDDDRQGREVLVRILEALGYEVESARDGLEALAKLKLEVDLVLLDARMPNLDGFEVTRRIRNQPEYLNLPIVMVTGHDSRDDRLRAAEVGVNDFISKPPEMAELKLRLRWLLRMKEAMDALRRQQSELEDTVERRTQELREALESMAEAQRDTYQAHLDTIRRLVLAAEYKDRSTAAHIERMGRYCELLGEKMGLPPSEVETLRHASQMHDVGKIGVPDQVLMKPGKLSDSEWKAMRSHPEIGARILMGSPSPVLRAGEVIALSHHEKWNGSGYPHGLAGEDIPLAGRICAVADVFDALTSDRHYREALPVDEVWEMMREERGKHFDPDILDIFVSERAAIDSILLEGGQGQ